MIRFLSLLALAGAAALITPGQAKADQTIRCESNNSQYQSCGVNTYGGVRLSRQLSRDGCWEGDTWGYDRNRIWVTRGCRAEFRIGSTSSSSGSSNGDKVAAGLVLGVIAAAIIADKNSNDHDRDRRYDNRRDNGNNYGYGNSRSFLCESNNDRYTRCNVSLRARDRVEIRRQLSRSACVYGRSWGVDRRQVWVDDGCRAEFTVY